MGAYLALTLIIDYLYYNTETLCVSVLFSHGSGRVPQPAGLPIKSFCRHFSLTYNCSRQDFIE